MNLEKGNTVIHTKLPEWGEGEVLELLSDNKVKIRFENVGIKVLKLEGIELEVRTKEPSIIKKKALENNYFFPFSLPENIKTLITSKEWTENTKNEIIDFIQEAYKTEESVKTKSAELRWRLKKKGIDIDKLNEQQQKIASSQFDEFINTRQEAIKELISEIIGVGKADILFELLGKPIVDELKELIIEPIGESKDESFAEDINNIVLGLLLFLGELNSKLEEIEELLMEGRLSSLRRMKSILLPTLDQSERTARGNERLERLYERIRKTLYKAGLSEGENTSDWLESLRKEKWYLDWIDKFESSEIKLALAEGRLSEMVRESTGIKDTEVMLEFIREIDIRINRPGVSTLEQRLMLQNFLDNLLQQLQDTGFLSLYMDFTSPRFLNLEKLSPNLSKRIFNLYLTSLTNNEQVEAVSKLFDFSGSPDFERTVQIFLIEFIGSNPSLDTSILL